MRTLPPKLPKLQVAWTTAWGGGEGVLAFFGMFCYNVENLYNTRLIISREMKWWEWFRRQVIEYLFNTYFINICCTFLFKRLGGKVGKGQGKKLLLKIPYLSFIVIHPLDPKWPYSIKQRKNSVVSWTFRMLLGIFLVVHIRSCQKISFNQLQNL